MQVAWQQISALLNGDQSWDNPGKKASVNQLLLQQLVLEQLRKTESWRYRVLRGPCESKKTVSFDEDIEAKIGDIVFVHQSQLKIGVIQSIDDMPFAMVTMHMFNKVDQVSIHVKLLSLLFRPD